MSEPTRTVYPVDDAPELPGAGKPAVPAAGKSEVSGAGAPAVPGGGASAAGKTLVERAGGASLVLATLVFFLNMAGAWWTMANSNELVARALVGEAPTTVSRALEALPGADANAHVLLNRLVDAELMLRTFQNHQTVAVVAMSTGFALVAVGFALFVMGAEGAFKLEGGVADRGNVVIKSTAPGLLCFVLATGLVCYAMFAIAPKLKPSDFQIVAGRAAAADTGETAPEEIARDGPEIPPLTGAENP